jgi:pimeloyl-ACP methyl ester carboxylesterase
MSSAASPEPRPAPAYRERAMRFGAHGGLVGVLTEPAPERAIAGAPVVMMANIGLNHHVGPYRLWVDLARCLASVGFSTLRFDNAGLGDSEPRRETVSDIERAVLDFGDAMTLLRERVGAQRFVVMSLCSGVDAAHRVSCRNADVVGSVFLDGYAHRTSGYNTRWWTQRWLQWARWRRFVRRRWIYKFAAATKGVRETGEVDEIFVREYPTLEELDRDFNAMVTRGTKLFFAYTGEVDHSYNGKDQLFEMFPSLRSSEAVTSEYYLMADHVYSFMRDRKRLIERLTTWMKENFSK